VIDHILEDRGFSAARRANYIDYKNTVVIEELPV